MSLCLTHLFRCATSAFWIGQIVWVWTVSLPLIILNSPAVSDPALDGSNPTFGTSRDIAGIVLWALGWAIESTVDLQKVCNLFDFYFSRGQRLSRFKVHIQIPETTKGPTGCGKYDDKLLRVITD